MAVASSISGTVTAAPNGAPLEDIQVCAWKEGWVGVGEEKVEERCTSSAADGSYVIDSVSEGTYTVQFWPPASGLNYVPEYYEDDRWLGSRTPVYVGPVAGIDAELEEGGVIEGQVTSEAGGAPIADLWVCAEETDSGENRCELTDSDGNYSIIGLRGPEGGFRNGEYRIHFDPERGGQKFTGEYYDDVSYRGQGSNIPIAPGSLVSGVDGALEPTSEIRGLVTVAATGAPIGGTLVCALTSQYMKLDEIPTLCDRTDGSGHYEIGDLEAGQYRVAFSLELREFVHLLPEFEEENDGYPTIYWDAESSWSGADVLTLTAPTLASGIDGRFGPAPAPVPSSSAAPSGVPLAAPAKRRCKHGFVRRKVRGKRRCVPRHRHKHPRRHRHHG
ncbi:MAG TPA: carboxypeptidase-like regulatory domain-containing protein [Solirubrobacterales bacterium]|nr:carboxypeptidase-like regulatory domain-containing protein [Solirubrobacterales bacterium]